MNEDTENKNTVEIKGEIYVPSQLTLIVDLQKRVKALEAMLTEDGIRRSVLPVVEKALVSDIHRRGVS